MNLGNNIKIARENKKITQKELAKRIEVSVISIQNYENNRRQPKIETLKKIAAALNVPLSNLTGDSIESYFNIIDSHKFEEYLSTKTSDGMTIDSIKDELLNIANEEHTKSIAYIENLTNFYTHIESIKHNGAFSDIDDIETKIKETNIDNFKKVLNPSDLEIALKSLLLTDSINNFLEDPKDIEIQKQLQIVLDYFDVPQGKKLKLNLVDSE